MSANKRGGNKENGRRKSPVPFLPAIPENKKFQMLLQQEQQEKPWKMQAVRPKRRIYYVLNNYVFTCLAKIRLVY
jgi:hypothetical protein